MILVTGANGFVGKALCRRMKHEKKLFRAAVRDPVKQPTGIESAVIGDIHAYTDWTLALKGVQTVVHLAARVHVMNEQSADPLADFRRINVEGTVNLARQAAAAGVKRFIFLSSIKVNGESTQPNLPFSADDCAAPEDAYGISKHEAEQLLWAVAKETGMAVVILRPPLVYGPDVKANFATLMRWVSRGVPLPLATITHNRRSFVALDNLVDLIVTCLTHPLASNQTFLVSDGEDLSTAELLVRMGVALSRPVRMFPVSAALLKFGASLIKKQNIYQRLCDSLQVDISKTRQLLDWEPRVTVVEGLRRAAKKRHE